MWFADYNSWKIDYDFAILELTTPIALTGESKARAACLPTASDKTFTAGTLFTVSGWGTTQWQGDQPHDLHFVKVPWVSDNQCKQAYSGITDQMICAGNWVNGGVDSCQGDSGGNEASTTCHGQYSPWHVIFSHLNVASTLSFLTFYITYFLVSIRAADLG